MAVSFETQSSLLSYQSSIEAEGKAPRLPAGRLVTSREWVAYFHANSDQARPLPWWRGAEVTAEDLREIAHSLQGWQLGETSDGHHLRAAAARHAAQIGDADYPTAVELF